MTEAERLNLVRAHPLGEVEEGCLLEITSVEKKTGTCGKAFKPKHNMTKHAVKCVPCRHCGKTFREQLARHERRCARRPRGALRTLPTLATALPTPATDPALDDRREAFTGDVDADEDFVDVVRDSWHSIRTSLKRHEVQDVLNIRMWDPENDDFETTLGDKVQLVWKSWHWSAKVNASVGCVLVHKDGDRYR